VGDGEGEKVGGGVYWVLKALHVSHVCVLCVFVCVLCVCVCVCCGGATGAGTKRTRDDSGEEVV